MRSESPRSGVDLTEAPFELSDAFKQAVAEKLCARDWRRYPALDQNEVKERVASFLMVDPACILFTRGADEGLRLAFQYAMQLGSSLLLPKPGFFGFERTAKSLGINFSHYSVPGDIPSPEEDVAVLCSPNNPSGHTFDLNKISQAVSARQGVLGGILDLTYDFFASDPLYPALSELCSLRLISCLSLSKAVALAGARIGIIVAQPDFVADLSKNQDRFSVDYFQLSVIDTLFDSQWTQEYLTIINWVHQARMKLQNLLMDLLPDVLLGPCEANFIPVYTDSISSEFVDILIENTACKIHRGDKLLRITVNRRSLEGVRRLHAAMLSNEPFYS